MFKIFEVTESEFHRFRLIRIIFFRKTEEILNLQANLKFSRTRYFKNLFKVIKVAEYEFHYFRLIRIFIFPEKAKIPNFQRYYFQSNCDNTELIRKLKNPC